jgi:hypothetical protein
MDQVAAMRYSRLGVTLVITAALWGCGQGEDKSKTEKKVESPPPPKATTPPAKPKPATEPAKPAAKAPTPESEGWVLLGKEAADFKGERDTIKVGGGSQQRRYKELRVIVEGGSVDVQEMIVTFGKQQQFRPQLQPFDGELRSQVIDLPGETRFINQVEFVYKTASPRNKGKATILLYGR